MTVERCFGCFATVPRVEGPTHAYMLSSPGCWKLFTGLLDELNRDADTAGSVLQNAVDAYAVQHPVFAPVESIDGCYLNVVGLPLCLLARMLRDSGVAIRPRPEWLLPQKCQECEGKEILTSGAKVRRWCGEIGEG